MNCVSQWHRWLEERDRYQTNAQNPRTASPVVYTQPIDKSVAVNWFWRVDGHQRSIIAVVTIIVVETHNLM